MTRWIKSSFSFANGNCVECAEAPSPWRKSSAGTFNGSCPEWRVSSHNHANGNCVEVGGGVMVRDSQDPDGPVLTFGAQEWAAFTSSLKA